MDEGVEILVHDVVVLYSSLKLEFMIRKRDRAMVLMIRKRDRAMVLIEKKKATEKEKTTTLFHNITVDIVNVFDNVHDRTSIL